MTGKRHSLATVLVIDDEKNIRQSIEMVLSQEGIKVLQAHDASSALRYVSEHIIDAIILDIKLQDISGLHLYKRLQADGLNAPTLFMSGHATLSEAAEAVKVGGYDFLEKPFTAEKLLITVKRCLEHSMIRQQVQILDNLKDQYQLIGQSKALDQVLSEARTVAATEASVLIQGESGTGKELLAHLIHRESPRRIMSFVKVNCSAIPESLIESELFGHEKGAFTSAQASKRGLFELAHRGTIFLDEVGDLTPGAQAKLLRVLQSGEIQKVGSEKGLRVDVRVVAATHKDLKNEVTHGRFRDDLYYRLNVIPIRLPALRERIDDMVLLVPHFIDQLAKKNNLKPKSYDGDFIAALKSYSWPGNIRELQNLIERLLILGGDVLGIADLPEDFQYTHDDQTVSSGSSPFLALKDFRDQAERAHIIAVIQKNHGNITQAACDLGVGRTYLHKRLSVLNINKSDFFQ